MFEHHILDAYWCWNPEQHNELGKTAGIVHYAEDNRSKIQRNSQKSRTPHCVYVTFARTDAQATAAYVIFARFRNVTIMRHAPMAELCSQYISESGPVTNVFAD
ncbi:unnamed protein product [Strongylus vulgaris]|uniref:Uncharacterized protein n=1 Tax=Strongylus vulgaris TaxID=40348 RepID=A0A3P7KHP1_STRVU|nr:unnamed protein product [Strongylus vulgaris]